MTWPNRIRSFISLHLQVSSSCPSLLHNSKRALSPSSLCLRLFSPIFSSTSAGNIAKNLPLFQDSDRNTSESVWFSWRRILIETGCLCIGWILNLKWFSSVKFRHPMKMKESVRRRDSNTRNREIRRREKEII